MEPTLLFRNYLWETEGGRGKIEDGQLTFAVALNGKADGFIWILLPVIKRLLRRAFSKSVVIRILFYHAFRNLCLDVDGKTEEAILRKWQDKLLCRSLFLVDFFRMGRMKSSFLHIFIKFHRKSMLK